MELSLSEIATITNGQLIGEDCQCQALTIDSRAKCFNGLFVALEGENHDGHQFIEDAIQHGAIAALVTKEVESSVPVVKVQDAVAALAQLGSAWRQRFSIPIVAITGSNGKTTVKEMVASIFRQFGTVLATRGNQNNHLGVPLTLLSIERHHEFAVVEMGANHIGEIDVLSKMTQPDVALINNANRAHLEGFGGLKGVAQAKSEIFNGLKRDGTAIVCRDDAFYEYWKAGISHEKFLSFGQHEEADVRLLPDSIEYIVQEQHVKTKFSADVVGKRVEFELPLLGTHNILNALAATSIAYACGLNLEKVSAGLSQVAPVKGRLQLKKITDQVTFIDDSYNANPQSLSAGMNVLKSLPGKKYLVLGDMAELGQDEQVLHQDAGFEAKQLGLDGVLTYGSLAAFAAAAFGSGGETFEQKNQLTERLKKIIQRHQADEPMYVLVKGSRRSGMEVVVEAFGG